MLRDCDGAKFRLWAAERARAMERGVIGTQDFLNQFGKSEDALVSELVELIRHPPRSNRKKDAEQYRFELDRVLEDLEDSS